MPTILLTPPSVEPVSLAEAKAYLRVEHGDDDDTIAALIAGSRIHVEAQTRRALITQSWRLSFDAWPVDGRINVRPAPLRALSAARYYDEAGATHVIDAQAFVPDLAGSALVFAPFLPAPGRIAATAEISGEVVAAAAAADARLLIAAICAERLAFLKSLRTWRVFGKGWGRRVAEVKAGALEMAAQKQEA